MADHPLEGTRALVIIDKGAISALLVWGIFTTVGLFGPALLLPQIEQSFSDAPNAALLTQLIGGITCFFFALGSPLAGMLIGRIGSRAVILPSLMLFGLTGVAPASGDQRDAGFARRAYERCTGAAGRRLRRPRTAFRGRER